jgi:DNA-binding HxlR family transcriptional regulator
VRRASFEEMNCSIARSLQIIGEWWSLLILRDAFLGVTRFETFQERLGIARNILSTRLDTLVGAGVMERRVYDEARDRADYVLTPMGRGLWPVLTAIRQWGDEWIVGHDHTAVEMVHESCVRAARAELVCSECGERLQLGDLRLVDGPGAGESSLIP